MRAYPASGARHLPVSVAEQGAAPEPAAVRLIDLGPESVSVLGGKWFAEHSVAFYHGASE